MTRTSVFTVSGEIETITRTLVSSVSTAKVTMVTNTPSLSSAAPAATATNVIIIIGNPGGNVSVGFNGNGSRFNNSLSSNTTNGPIQFTDGVAAMGVGTVLLGFAFAFAFFLV